MRRRVKRAGGTVNAELAVIFNRIFEGRKSAKIEQIFTESGQFQIGDSELTVFALTMIALHGDWGRSTVRTG